MKLNDIVLQIEIGRSVESAWRPETDNSELEGWLCEKADVDASLNGLYQLFWGPENPQQNSTIGCKILDLVEHRLLAFEWKGPVPFAYLMNSEPLPTWV